MDSSTTTVSPKRGILKGSFSPVLEKSLILKQNRSSIRTSLFWATVNATILFILMYDLSYTCSLTISYYEYAEYVLVTLIFANVVYYIVKIFFLIFQYEQIPVTPQQKKLLGIKDHDSSFKIVPESLIKSEYSPGPFNLSSMNLSCSSRFSTTPMNSTANSWLGLTPNESGNLSLSTSWIYQRAEKGEANSRLSPKGPSYYSSQLFSESFKIDPIIDEASLNEFLKERDTLEKINRIQSQSPQSSNLLSNFWRHPTTKNPKDSFVLSKCKYQLSPISRDKSITTKMEDNSLQGSIDGLEHWTRLNVDIVALTQWNENLRKWISQTILERLVHEIDTINTTLEKHGLNDVCIGSIGLDRLRKASVMVPVVNLVPSLRTLLTFLEITPNQEYLIERLRQLARGGCMSEFRWNSGGDYNRKPWSDVLPTDCAIIMHLFVVYLDTQLMPLPNAPDVKPFSGYHYFKSTVKIPPLNSGSIFIHQVSEKPPHFRIIVRERVYEMGKGYNNMFHTILFFLYNINTMGQGMIGRVNLGKAGVNMLWIIGQ